MIIKSVRRGGGVRVSTPAPVKVEESKVIPEVEVEEETIEDPDDGEGEG